MPSIIENRNIGNASNVKIFDLSQFQSNANVVYPAGTLIYYKRGNGQVTGIYKVADGVTTLANLPLNIDDYIIQSDNHTTIKSSDALLDSLKSNYNGSGYNLSLITKKIGKSHSTGTWAGGLFMILVPIHYPMTISGIGVSVASVSTGGNVNMGIYTPNATYDVWTAVSGSITPAFLIKNAGYNVYTYATPFTLDVGLYGIAIEAIAAVNMMIYVAIGVNNTILPTNVYGLSYPPSNFIRTEYYNSTALGTLPSTINSQLNLRFDNIFAFLLLNNPSI